MQCQVVTEIMINGDLRNHLQGIKPRFVVAFGGGGWTWEGEGIRGSGDCWGWGWLLCMEDIICYYKDLILLL